MRRAYKYRLYPTPKQIAVIDQQFCDLRWLYNTALEQRIRAYSTNETSIYYHDQAIELPAIKEQFPQFKSIHSQVLQDTLKRLDKAFQNFFRRVRLGQTPGFPRFKGKHFFNSLCYPQNGFWVNGNRLTLSKIGDVRVKLHRAIPEHSKVKTCTILKEGDKWYCCLSFDLQMVVQKKIVENSVGIDLGIENFATLSNGFVVPNPKHYRNSQDKLAQLQQRYSKSKSSVVRKKLVRLHRKIANQRRDFLHKTSYTLANNFDLIAYEDLNIQGMNRKCKPVENEDGTFAPNGQSRKSGLNKSINDAGWGMFISMIKYKAESAGSYAIAVNPRNTSQICSNCGAVVKKELSERLHVCTVCSTSIHRDLNAAKNILSGIDKGIKVTP